MEQTTAKEIREKIKLTTEDHEKFGLEEREDLMTGSRAYTPESVDPEKNLKLLEEVEVELNKTHTTLLKDVATKLDDEKKVSPFNLDTVVKLKAMRG